MDINYINDCITDLESSDTSFENIQELAYLYIIKDNLNKYVKLNENNVIDEYNDILPQYNRYIEIKRKYQLGELVDEELIKHIKNVVKEIKEFIETLYSSTDMEKERRQIRLMLEQLYNEYCL